MLRFLPGYGVDDATGLLARDESCATNWMPVPVAAGDRLAPAPGVELRVLAYDDDTDPWLIYSYDYSPESNWTHYRPDLSLPGWCGALIKLGFSGWARVSARWADGRPVAAGDVPQVDLEQLPWQEPPMPEHFSAEVDRVCRRVEELRKPDDLVLLLVADIHYAAGCPWPDTVRNLRAVAERICPDALVQLGDLTDGLLPSPVMRATVDRVLGDLRSVGLPMYGCVGNHDANYFRDNPDTLDRHQRSMIYLGRDVPWYKVDFAEKRLRCIFLDWFEPTRKERYGFGREEIRWLRRALDTLPAGWGVVVFCHGPLMAQMHVWSKRILGERQVRKLLQALDRRADNATIAFVHGHNHSDQMWRTYGFPMVSVGCTKFEDFSDHKPWGSVTAHRRADTAGQELWNVVLVNAEDRSARFVRFGSGEDVEVTRR